MPGYENVESRWIPRQAVRKNSSLNSSFIIRHSVYLFSHWVFCDNYYTSRRLEEMALEEDTYFIGTLHVNFLTFHYKFIVYVVSLF